MERWQGKVAVVTGASSGIGEAIAEDLVKSGFIVIALARRESRLRENQSNLPVDLQSKYHPVKCDVTNEGEVKTTFEWIEKNFGGTDVLVNNAGIARLGVKLSSTDNSQDIRDTVDTNIMATVFCVREAFASMKKRNFDGHIIVISSVLGHEVPFIPNNPFNIYPATKFALKAMTETYRQEFTNAGTKVKITSISPGLTATEAVTDMEARKKAGMPFLDPKDVSSTVLFAISTPPHVQIHELIIKPLGEGRL